MKKLIAMLLVLVMALSLIACGAQPAADPTEKPTTGAEEPTAEATQGATEAADSDLAYVQENGKLIVGITDYEPMDYLDENGEWTGFDAELAKMFAEELGVECEFFVLADWGKKFMELDTKSIDVVWNGMTITEEAQLNASVSDPYVVNAQVVVMKGNKVDKFTTAESMKDLSIAVENGSAGQEAAALTGSSKIVAVQDQGAALMEVAAGTSDACVIDITMANAMTGEGTDYSDLAAGISLTSEEYGVAFRTGSDLTEALNQFLAEKKADGSLAELAEKYQLTLAD